MLFKTADPQANGRAAELVLRKELGWQQPVPFTAHGSPPPRGAVSILAHMAAGVQSGQAPYEQAIVFEAPYPFAWSMSLQVVRTAGHYIVGARQVFATMLRGKVPGHMAFAARGAPGWTGGDPALVAQLDQDQQLAGSLRGNVRTQIKFGKTILSLGHYVWLTPEQDGTLFLFGTMPAVDWKMSASFNAPAFLWAAGRIQEHLDYRARAAAPAGG